MADDTFDTEESRAIYLKLCEALPPTAGQGEMLQAAMNLMRYMVSAGNQDEVQQRGLRNWVMSETKHHMKKHIKTMRDGG